MSTDFDYIYDGKWIWRTIAFLCAISIKQRFTHIPVEYYGDVIDMVIWYFLCLAAIKGFLGIFTAAIGAARELD